MSEIPIGVVTISDRASAGLYEDKGGPGIEAALAAILATPWRPVRRLAPDERAAIEAALRELADVPALLADPDHRGHRPQPARRDAGGDASGSPNWLMPGVRRIDARAQPAGGPDRDFSRQIAGLRGRSLIVNLPGRPSAIGACLDAVFPAVPYCLDLIGGDRLETNPEVCAAFRPKG